MPKISRIEALKAMEEVQSERQEIIEYGVYFLLDLVDTLNHLATVQKPGLRFSHSGRVIYYKGIRDDFFNMVAYSHKISYEEAMKLYDSLTENERPDLDVFRKFSWYLF